MQQPGNSQKPSLSFVCPEDWDKMTACEQGRFCGSCQKTVLDFTHKSELEIQELLSKQTGKVCGRFYTHQLAQPVHSNRFSFRRVFSSVLVLLGLSFLSKEAEAQQKKKAPEKKHTQTKPKPNKDSELTPLPPMVLTGIVGVDGPLPNSDVVYNPEVMPVYKSEGEIGMHKFSNANKKPIKDGAEGLVITSFIVDTLGKVNDIQIVKMLSDEANKEALRLTSLLEFEPGMQNGRKVKVRYTLPIRFYKEEKK